MKPIKHILGIDDKKGFDLRRRAGHREYVVSDVHIIGYHEVARIKEEDEITQHWWKCRRCGERSKERDYFKGSMITCHNCNCDFCEI